MRKQKQILGWRCFLFSGLLSVTFLSSCLFSFAAFLSFDREGGIMVAIILLLFMGGIANGLYLLYPVPPNVPGGSKEIAWLLWLRSLCDGGPGSSPPVGGALYQRNRRLRLRRQRHGIFLRLHSPVLLLSESYHQQRTFWSSPDSPSIG